MLCTATGVMNAIFPAYAEVVGLGAVVGGLMVSTASLCDIVFNPLAGATSDKFGPAHAMVLWTGITMVSFVVLYFSGSSAVGSCVGAGLNDAMYAITGVGYSTFALSIFGMRNFEKIFSRITCCGYLVASFGIPLMMLIYESTGVFQNVFVFGFVVDIVIIGLVILAKKSSRTLRWLSD